VFATARSGHGAQIGLVQLAKIAVLKFLGGEEGGDPAPGRPKGSGRRGAATVMQSSP
jgi:hypothetical protein